MTLAKNCVGCGAIFQKRKEYSHAYWRRQRFCSSQCCGRTKTKLAAIARPERAALFAKWVDKSGDCWIWTGAKDKDGYGIFTYARKTYRANREALALDGRTVPAGWHACHKCDNPTCVRPDHLYPGSPLDNVADTISRGHKPVGEACGRSNLTEADICAIRASSETNSVLGARYGVAPSNISMIKTRKTWRHVE